MIPDWVVKQKHACTQAAKRVQVTNVKPVRRGLILSRRHVWQRENPIPLARWHDSQDSTLVVLDRGKKRRGMLMLIRGNVAVEVRLSVEDLEAIYEPHQRVAWWRDTKHHPLTRIKRRAA